MIAIIKCIQLKLHRKKRRTDIGEANLLEPKTFPKCE